MSRLKVRLSSVKLVFYLLFCAPVIVVEAAVTLSKCCELSQTLQPEGVCKADIHEEHEQWIPHIYAPNPEGGFSTTTLDPSKSSIIYNSRPICDGGKLPTLVQSPAVSPAFLLMLDYEEGTLNLLLAHEEQGATFPPESFCVDKYTALVCDAPRQDGVRKCCGRNSGYSHDLGACVHGEEHDTPELSRRVTGAGFPACPEGWEIVEAGYIGGNLSRSSVVNWDTGALQLTNPPDPPKTPEEYCLERVVGKEGVSMFVCAAIPTQIVPASEQPGDIRFTVFPAALIISAVFLTATLATGFLLPKSHQHALHWRCQTCHVACLLVGCVLLATVQLAGSALPPPACIIMAVAMHFFFLAAFFWLNAMCFNIWWTFRDLRPMSADPGQERVRYRAYSGYAWGGPFVLAVLALLLDLLDEEITEGMLKPRFGEIRCWFYGDWEILAFFYGPIGVLLLLNLALFAATTRELTCGLWRREGVKSATAASSSSSERSTLGLVCMKLVVVMGVTWVADIISWAVGGPTYVWFLTDLINALQGVFIFVVVGCQKQVWCAIKRLWWCSRGGSAGQATTGANPMSCSSQGAPSTLVAADHPSSPHTQVAETSLETTC